MATVHNAGADVVRRVEAGDTVESRELTTITGEPVRLPATDTLVHLQFRRFAGCPLCNVHLRSVARRYDEIVAAGVAEVVVFHSAVADMMPYQGDLPFAAVADPDRLLYTEFGVGSSPRSVLHPRAWTAPLHARTWGVVAAGVRAGVTPFRSIGDGMLGLPADFLIESGGRVRAARYGRHAADQWSVDDLLRLAERG